VITSRTDAIATTDRFTRGPVRSAPADRVAARDRDRDPDRVAAAEPEPLAARDPEGVVSRDAGSFVVPAADCVTQDGDWCGAPGADRVFDPGAGWPVPLGPDCGFDQNGDWLFAAAFCAVAQNGLSSVDRGAYRGGSGGVGGAVSAGVDRAARDALVAFLRGLYRPLAPDSDIISLFPSLSRPQDVPQHPSHRNHSRPSGDMTRTDLPAVTDHEPAGPCGSETTSAPLAVSSAQ
jgi:hypothetical protein